MKKEATKHILTVVTGIVATVSAALITSQFIPRGPNTTTIQISPEDLLALAEEVRSSAEQQSPTEEVAAANTEIVAAEITDEVVAANTEVVAAEITDEVAATNAEVVAPANTEINPNKLVSDKVELFLGDAGYVRLDEVFKIADWPSYSQPDFSTLKCNNISNQSEDLDVQFSADCEIDFITSLSPLRDDGNGRIPDIDEIITILAPFEICNVNTEICATKEVEFTVENTYAMDAITIKSTPPDLQVGDSGEIEVLIYGESVPPEISCELFEDVPELRDFSLQSQTSNCAFTVERKLEEGYSSIRIMEDSGRDLFDIYISLCLAGGEC